MVLLCSVGCYNRFELFLCRNLVLSKFDIRLVSRGLQPVRVVSCVVILCSVGSTSDLLVVAYEQFEFFLV